MSGAKPLAVWEDIPHPDPARRAAETWTIQFTEDALRHIVYRAKPCGHVCRENEPWHELVSGETLNAMREVCLKRTEFDSLAHETRAAFAVTLEPEVRAAAAASLAFWHLKSGAFPSGSQSWEACWMLLLPSGAFLILRPRDANRTEIVTCYFHTVACDAKRRKRRATIARYWLQTRLKLARRSHGDTPFDPQVLIEIRDSYSRKPREWHWGFTCPSPEAWGFRLDASGRWQWENAWMMTKFAPVRTESQTRFPSRRQAMADTDGGESS